MRIFSARSKLNLITILSVFIPFGLFAQSNITTVGIQIKPIISGEFLNTGPQSETIGDIEFTVAPANGFSFGMVVRQGFNDQFSLETGINYSRRNYDLTIREDSTGFVGESDFTYVIYEIPILGLIYVRLGENSYLNTAFGINFNFLPSDWESFDSYYQHFSARSYWVIPALQANVGFEYRTRESGFWYVGFSYHQPFDNLTTAIVAYNDEATQLEKEITTFDIQGNYLTLDLRYFFNEPAKRRRR